MSGLVVLDGHAIIDTPTGITEVGTEVFRAIGVCRFVILVAPPEIIVARRNMDRQRKRPERTIEEIHQHQEQSLASARSAAHALDVPISIIQANESHELAALLMRDAAG
jgi:adenylate kinase